MKYSNFVIGRVIRDLRLKKPCTITQMAASMHTSLSTWARIEAGESSLRVNDFEQFCEVVGVTHYKFFMLVKDYKPKVLR